jgi:hypothetical protein
MTPKQRRSWLVKQLYESYMKVPWTTESWTSSGGGDEDFMSIYREVEWLMDKGFIHIKNLSHSGVSARITPRGRDAFEAGEFATETEPVFG